MNPYILPTYLLYSHIVVRISSLVTVITNYYYTPRITCLASYYSLPAAATHQLSQHNLIGLLPSLYREIQLAVPSLTPV